MSVGRLAQRSPRAAIGLLALTTLLPLLVLGWASVALATRAVSQQAQATVRAAAVSNADYVSKEMTSLAELVQSYAERPVLRAALATRDPATFDRAVVSAQLAALRGSRPGIAITFLAEPDGRLVDINPATPTIVGQNFSGRDWYRGLTRTGRPYVSEAYRSAATGRPLVTAAAAHVPGRAEGEPLAILVAAYGLDTLQGVVQQSDRGSRLGLTIADQRGTVVASSRRDGSVTVGEKLPYGAASGRSDVTVDSSWVVARAPVPALGWTVAAEVAKGDAFAAVRTLRTTVLTLGAVLALVILGGLWLQLRTLRARARTEEELTLASEQAYEGARLKAEFLANMSHEIRTPMNGVLGMTELLLDTELTAEQREYAQTVHGSAESLLGVVDQILDFSKIEAGRLELEELDFDLRTCVEEAVGVMCRQADALGLELTVVISPDVPDRVRADPGRLRQVLVNLTGNAVKFTAEGEVCVRVSRVADDPQLLRFEVADTGIGIPADLQARIFDSFAQADTSTTRRFGGTGLGLSISRQLTRLLGGDIGLSSSPAGSTFWFTARFAEPLLLAAELSRVGLRGRRALVVDDNATNRLLLTESLMAWGMSVDVAHDGPSGLAAFRSATQGSLGYDVALLDFHMPGQNGVQLAQALRREQPERPLRLVLLTSGGMRGDAAAARRAGIDSYLTKPVRHAALYDALSTVLGLQSAPGAAPLVTVQALTEQPAGDMPRLLVVEDNPVNQLLAVRLLEARGYRVDLAGNGREAVEAVRRQSYAAILMDCQMPEMDGYEATMAIRNLEGERRTPIIAMTAGALPGDRDKSLSAGMDAHLTKPIRRDQLWAVLDSWLNQPAPAEAEVRSDSVASDAAVASLDPLVLQDLRDLEVAAGQPLLAPLLQAFLRAAQEGYDEAARCAAVSDWAGLARTAHRLRGSSGAIGAARVATSCAVLEQAARRGDGTALVALETVHAELDRVRPELEAELSRL